MDEKKYIPHHIAIIMDGNRRWAREHNLPTFEGHRRGYDKLKEVGDWCLDSGVHILTVFAFSTENWNRSAEEVSYLMDLLYRAFTREVDEFKRRNLRIKVLGRREGLPENVRDAADEIERETAHCTRGTLQLCVNYGGHAEITDAVKAMIREGVSADEVTPELITAHLYAPDTPSPDLIIRTSGEERLSGFLTWESAYSELYFTDVHWPAFTKTHLSAALATYAERERRFGK